MTIIGKVLKNLVELMGGEIHVTIEYGKGSVFTAIIPQQIVNPEPLGDFTQKYQQYTFIRDESSYPAGAKGKNSVG